MGGFYNGARAASRVAGFVVHTDVSPMCGRYLLRAGLKRIERAFGIRWEEWAETPRDLPLRFNIAPSQAVPIVRNRAGREMAVIRRADGTTARELVTVRWGLIPAWAKEPSIGNRMINARAEGIADKPSFRAAFKARRCIVPASGFYEWKHREREAKQPYMIKRTDGDLIGFAGLWERWHDRKTGEVIETCAIITCEPNALMAELHNRMPVILDPADYERWLDPGVPGGEELLRPCPEEWLEAVPVSTRVNSPANDDEGVLQPEGEVIRAQGRLL